MKKNWLRFMSGNTLRETLATVGVIISMVFAGMQIHENNIPTAPLVNCHAGA